MSRRRSRAQTRSSSRPASATPSRSEPPAIERDRLWAMGLVLLFVFFAWKLATVTPLVTDGSLINAPDEAAHVGYVKALAIGHRLPTRADRQFPTYQWHQPPLYYAAAALGHPLGLLGMRAVSVLFGLISLWAIWATARLLAPKRPDIPVMAVALAALLPMRQAVHSAVGNDAAIECLFSLSMLTAARIVTQGANTGRALWLGVLVGAAILTKLSGVLLLPGAALVLAMSGPSASVTVRIRRALWPMLAAVAIASPWLALNVARYGQMMPIRAFHEEFAKTSRASDWIGQQRLGVDHMTGDLRPGPVMDRRAYFALVADWSVRTFFGAFTTPARAAIGAPSFLPPSFYWVWGVIFMLGAIGAVRTAAFGLWKSSPARSFALAAGMTTALILLSFVGFTWTYFQAQGRYLYPCLLPIAIGWATGYTAFMPARYRTIIMVLTVVVMATLAAAYGFVYVGSANGRA